MLDLQKYIGFPKMILHTIDPLTVQCDVQYLPRWIGHTIGNAMRRIMLWYDMAWSITGLKVNGATHEYHIIDGMKESIVDVILNLKKLRFIVDESLDKISYVSQSFSGVGTYSSENLRLPTGITLLNQDTYLFEITDPNLTLTFDIRFEKWYWYYSIEYLRNRDKDAEDADQSMILIDNDFRVMDYVTYSVEEVIDDFSGSVKDKLILTVKSYFENYSPKQFLVFAGEVLSSYAKLFVLDDIYIDKSVLATYADFEHEDRGMYHTPDMIKSTPIDALPLSERTRNALIKNGILYVENLEKKKKWELIIMKWVGRKAIDEINAALANLDKTLAG